MKKPSFAEALEEILDRDPRYPEAAYHFVREALDHTIQLYEKPVEGAGRHVSGRELVEGIRRFALTEYGAMAQSVLRHWEITETVDFGHIVFNLVEQKVLGKTEDDKLEDFANGYNFDEAFTRPFRPARKDEPAATPPSD